MKFKKITFIIFLFAFVILNLSIVIAINNNENNINNHFRIHVVANSDSINDQILKLNVSKQVDEYVKTITKDCVTKQDYINAITNNIYNILNLSNKILQDYNSNYTVTAYIGKIKYDEKVKDGFSMEKGIYDSLKLVIGDGKGENWWSLLFSSSIQNYETEEVLTNNDIYFSSGFVELFTNFINNLNF